MTLEWTKEPISGKEFGMRTDGYYVGRSPKNWWHLYQQQADGSWCYAAGGFASLEDAMAAAGTGGKPKRLPKVLPMVDVELPG